MPQNCLFPIGRNGDLTPADAKAMRDYIQTYRTTDAPFDVVLGGRAREQDAADAAAMLASHAAAGVTWWLESFWADELSKAQEVIRRGPPQSARL